MKKIWVGLNVESGEDARVKSSLYDRSMSKCNPNEHVITHEDEKVVYLFIPLLDHLITVRFDDLSRLLIRFIFVVLSDDSTGYPPFGFL